MMKKTFISLVAIGLLFGFAHATYIPTSQDIAQITLLKTQFDTITSGVVKDKRDFYAQLKTLEEQFPNHQQLNYYLNELDGYLLTQVNIEKAKAKITSKAFKQDFVNSYSG